MTDNTKVVLLRFVRGVAAVAVASAATFVVGDEFLGIVPDAYDFLVVGIGAPALLALEKFIRDGGAGDAKPRVAVATPLGVSQPIDEPVLSFTAEPEMSVRKLASLRGTPEDPLTLDGQPKRNI